MPGCIADTCGFSVSAQTGDFIAFGLLIAITAMLLIPRRRKVAKSTDTIKARWVDPAEIGWVHQRGNVWLLPDGRQFEFAPTMPHEVAICDDLWLTTVNHRIM